MYRVDITADLNDEDETGYVWTCGTACGAESQMITIYGLLDALYL